MSISHQHNSSDHNLRNEYESPRLLPADRPDAPTRLSTAGLTFMQAGLHSDRLDEVGGARLLRQVDNKPDRETNGENIFPPHHSPLGSYWQISDLTIFRWLPSAYLHAYPIGSTTTHINFSGQFLSSHCAVIWLNIKRILFLTSTPCVLSGPF